MKRNFLIIGACVAFLIVFGIVGWFSTKPNLSLNDEEKHLVGMWYGYYYNEDEPDYHYSYIMELKGDKTFSGTFQYYEKRGGEFAESYSYEDSGNWKSENNFYSTHGDKGRLNSLVNLVGRFIPYYSSFDYSAKWPYKLIVKNDDWLTKHSLETGRFFFQVRVNEGFDLPLTPKTTFELAKELGVDVPEDIAPGYKVDLKRPMISPKE